MSWRRAVGKGRGGGTLRILQDCTHERKKKFLARVLGKIPALVFCWVRFGCSCFLFLHSGELQPSARWPVPLVWLLSRLSSVPQSCSPALDPRAVKKPVATGVARTAPTCHLDEEHPCLWLAMLSDSCCCSTHPPPFYKQRECSSGLASLRRRKYSSLIM